MIAFRITVGPVSVILLWMGLVLSAKAEELQLEHDGLMLNANLEMADGTDFSDGMILITHALMQHHRMEIIRTLQALLLENGYSSLAVTLSAAVNDRAGPYDCNRPHLHTWEDSENEILLWLDWLRTRGSKQVVLMGHSGGANRLAYLMGRYRDPAVVKLVLITPGTADNTSRTPEGYRTRYGKDIEPILEHAQTLVDAGRGDEILPDTDFLYCPSAPVSARSFVSYYGPMRDYRLFPVLLPKLPVPTLFVGASEDNVAPDMQRLVTPYVDGERIRLVMIEGAGHFLRDLNLEEAVDEIVAFLDE